MQLMLKNIFAERQQRIGAEGAAPSTHSSLSSGTSFEDLSAVDDVAPSFALTTLTLDTVGRLVSKRADLH